MPEFIVEFKIEGTMSMTLSADSEEEAKKKIDEIVDEENWVPDLDEVTWVHYDIRELIPVLRNGKKVKTTYVMKGDVRI